MTTPLTNMGSNLQLAKTVPMTHIKFPAIAETKYDGVRCIMVGNKFYTRSGKQIHLPKISSTYNIFDNMLDMEVVVNDGKMVDRQVVSGMINSAIHGKGIDENALNFKVFAGMPATYYYKKQGITHISIRKSMRCTLDRYFMDPRISSKFVSTSFIDVYDLDELMLHYDNVREEGFEGLVVKHKEDVYQFKRSNQWARFKDTKTADLMCVDVIEGQGKYTGMIGSLLLEGTISNKAISVHVGSGLTDSDRLESEDYFIGKTIEVKYNSITTSKTCDVNSLFLPRFVMIREDK